MPFSEEEFKSSIIKCNNSSTSGPENCLGDISKLLSMIAHASRTLSI